MHIRDVAAAKEIDRHESKWQGKVARQAKYCAARRERRQIEQAVALAQSKQEFRVSEKLGDYLALPTEEQRRARIAAFIDATGNNALSRAVCIVCAQELTCSEGMHTQRGHAQN